MNTTEPSRGVISPPTRDRWTIGTTVANYRPGEVVFLQGHLAHSVMYVQKGVVKLSVLSRSGKEAVVALLEPGAFFGETALAGHPVRTEVATAMTAATVLIIPKPKMIRLLHTERDFLGRFIAHMLARNSRIEEDVVDQMLNSSEKRLARTLLRLAHYGEVDKAHRVLPRLSQQTLADMVGTTRSRVNFFLNKFKRLGHIDDSDGMKVNDSLVTIILPDEPVRIPLSKTG